MTRTLVVITLPLLLACGPGGDGTDTSHTGGQSETGHAETAHTSTAGTTVDPTTGAGTGSGSATTTSTSGTSTSTSTSSTGPDVTTTGPNTSSTANTGDQTETGGHCVPEGQGCIPGESDPCCAPAMCCSGVPVPPGQEFCGVECPMSDRNLKTDIRDIDPAEILQKVANLPLSTWRYKVDKADIRHLGPMAQDFHAAFELWGTDKMIFPLDASGVSLAAIQALHARVVAAEAENRQLRDRLDALERRLADQ